MSQLGRPTRNNKTFDADFVDSQQREYSYLEEAELLLYEDTTKLLPMNFRLPKKIPVEKRALAPEIGHVLVLANPETKSIIAKGRVAEMWLIGRSNCGLIFFEDFSRFADNSVVNGNNKQEKAS